MRLKMVTIIVNPNGWAFPTFGDVEELFRELHAIDTSFSYDYVFNVTVPKYSVGLNENEMIVQVFTDNPSDLEVIKQVFKKLSFPSRSAPTIFLQHIQVQSITPILGSQ